MRGRAIRIISNIKHLERAIPPAESLQHERIAEGESALRFLLKCLRSDLVILNIDQRKLMLACLLRWLWPWSRFKLVSTDLILRPPRRWKDRCEARLKGLLFSRVDRFVLYFKNLQGYARFYGIKPERAAYIPFKVNGWEQIAARPPGLADGAYALCAGRTLRDTETFVEAARRAGCPSVLLQQRRELLAAHGTLEWGDGLPANVKLVVDNSDRLEDFLEFIGQAQIVVIPRFRDDIAPTGISTYLAAMALNKCVIISAGPGAEDVLTDGQAVIVPPENPARLAEQLKELWEDDTLRRAIAARGHAYARLLAGEQRLLADILRVSLDELERPKV